jgi:hypothetical protein
MSPFFFNSFFILAQYIILKLNVSSHSPVYENSGAAPPLILATSRHWLIVLNFMNMECYVHLTVCTLQPSPLSSPCPSGAPLPLLRLTVAAAPLGQWNIVIPELCVHKLWTRAFHFHRRCEAEVKWEMQILASLQGRRQVHLLTPNCSLQVSVPALQHSQ